MSSNKRKGFLGTPPMFMIWAALLVACVLMVLVVAFDPSGSGKSACGHSFTACGELPR